MTDDPIISPYSLAEIRERAQRGPCPDIDQAIAARDAQRDPSGPPRVVVYCLECGKPVGVIKCSDCIKSEEGRRPAVKANPSEWDE